MPFNGAMLTNENVLASLGTLTDWSVGAVSIVEADRVLCVDSLASIHQRVLHLAIIRAGATMAFAHRGLLTLKEDVGYINPTIVAASGGILHLLHAAARRALKQMGRLRRFITILKLRWRARSYWRTGDLDLLRQTPFKELKMLLAKVHTVIAAPSLASSELIKELQLLYSIIVVHACCSPQTGIAFSSRQQNGESLISSSVQRIRAAPLGWVSPVVAVSFEKLSPAEEASLMEFHADGASGRPGHTSHLILDASGEASTEFKNLASDATDFDGFRLSAVGNRRGHVVTEGEIVIQGACVSVGYYRHQTAFQRQITNQGMYRTGLVAASAGSDFPLLMIGTLSRSVLTAEGEFIDLEEAERQLRKVPIVRRVLLYADDFHSPLVAIIQPRKGAALRWAKTRFAYSDDYGASYENLVSLPALRDFVLKQIEEHTRLSLESFERPKAIYLVPHDVELPVGIFDKLINKQQDERTVSRSQLADAYMKPIKEMYASLAD
ncbi:uncharacterized protein LOC34617943 [Cyclospora cayetanensis]|nr:uncharacterized protein LOC34617943 [Cyclospora cayetanensis]